jgi:short-subunit dehydrogenase
MDVAKDGADGDILDAVTTAGVEVDLLVNNPGAGHTGRFHEQPPERLAAMVDLNVRSVVALTRRFLPPMVARGRGAIVNVVSMAAFQPVPYLATYAASKAFLLSFTEALAVELKGSGVAVQALCPGNIPTGFQEIAGTDKVAFNRVPPMSAAEVAEASLRALEKGTVVTVPGLRDRALLAVQRFAPRALVLRISASLFRPPAV